MRVLHVLHTSLPALAGYTIRTSYILDHLARLGCEVGAVTSARQPESGLSFEVIKGVPHWRTPSPKRSWPSPLDELQAMLVLTRRLHRVLREHEPDVIHAHSPMLVGLPALRAAKSAGIPLVYEVRGLWEDSSVDRGKFRTDSLPYRAAEAAETAVLCRAQAVVTICESLRRELEPRARQEVHVVGNGVDVDGFAPRPKNPEAAARWGCERKQVVGYIGSFQPYEGLETLVRAFAEVTGRVADAHLVITGSGTVEDQIKRLTADLGLTGHVTFTGRVSHDQVLDIYGLADVMVYPRIATRTTRLTTPLKPLEAMAMAKPVVVSDVPAMRELVRPGETGLAFPAGDCHELGLSISSLLADPRLRESLGRRAREHVMAERQWGQLVARYLPIYESVRRRAT